MSRTITDPDLRGLRARLREYAFVIGILIFLVPALAAYVLTLYRA